MTHFLGTFYTPEPDLGPKFRKKLDPRLLDPSENPDKCFFWLQNHPNIGVCIVRTISNIFALAMEKR